MRIRLGLLGFMVLTAFLNAQSYYIWRQNAWHGNVSTTLVSSTKEGNSNYYGSDGNLFISGVDYYGSGVVILKPLGVISPMMKSRADMISAGMNPINSASGMIVNTVLGTNTYEEGDSVDGNGSYRAGLFPASTYHNPNQPRLDGCYAGMYYKQYIPYAYDGFHPTITTNTNIFLLFFLKYDGYAHTNAPQGNAGGTNSMMNFMYFLRHPISGDIFPVSNMYSLCAASNKWMMASGQFQIWSNRFPNLAGQLGGAETIQSGFLIQYGMSGFPNRSFAAICPTNTSGAFVGHTIWLDQVIAAHHFSPTGELYSSPIAVPRYYNDGTAVRPFVSLDGLAFGGIQGLTNIRIAVANSVMSNTNLNHYAGSTIAIQIRSGRTLTELFTNSWYGSTGLPGSTYTAALTNSETQTNSTANLPAYVQNGLFFQYKVIFNSAIQGVSPILTNVYLFFKYTGAGATSFADPIVFSYSGTNLASRTFILAMSNYYDPVNTKIYAFNARRPNFEVAVESVNDHLQPFTTPKNVNLSTTTLAADKYSLLISNNGNPNVVILTDVLDLGATPSGSAAIDTTAIRRGYIPVNNRIDLQFGLNTVGTRNVLLEIFDTTGKMVYKTQSNSMPTGTAVMTWQPSGGRKIATGVYLYSVTLMSESGTADSKKGMLYVVK